VLENAVLARMLPEFADAWPAARGGEEGYTRDGSVNRFVRDARERVPPAFRRSRGSRRGASAQVRYDRVMVKGFRTAAAEVLGSAPAAGGLFASDHFGVSVDLESDLDT